MRRARLLGVFDCLAAALLILTLMQWEVDRASASINSGSEVVQLVNQLRRANGLPPYQVSQALMAAAQAHSEYQAAQSSLTHTGQGGSRPRDRAVANGYGGGASVSVSENIAGGVNLSAADAISMWQGDNLHLTTMLSPNYQDIGAGVAVDGDMVYFTLDVGSVSGAAPLATSGSASTTSRPAQGTPGTTAATEAPILTSTPQTNGAVVHVVEHGQVLWNIAAAYKVSLAEIMALNNLTERSVIYPGNKLLIKPAEATPVISVTQTISASVTVIPPSNTPRPTRTPPAPATSTPSAAAPSGGQGDTSSQQEQAQAGFKTDPLLILIGVLVLVGTGLVVAGNVMKRKGKETNPPPPP
jgi:LysM repeat protein